MPYIGTQPLTGQFKKLDAITVVNGQAAYTLNHNSAPYKPATANALLVSVNGVIQAAGDAFNISGSTITFTENLVTGDVIDFIIALGDTGSAVTPVDGSVTTAKLGDDSVTEAKLANSLDMQNITLKGGTTDALTIDSSGLILTPARPAFFVSYDASSTLGLNGIINFNTVHTNIGSHFDISNDRFVAPIAGLYHFSFSGLGSAASNGVVGSAGNGIRSEIQYSTDSGSSYTTFAHGYGNVNSSNFWPNISCSGTVLLAAGAWVVVNMSAGYAYGDNSGRYDPRFSGFLVG